MREIHRWRGSLLPCLLMGVDVEKEEVRDVNERKAEKMRMRLRFILTLCKQVLVVVIVSEVVNCLILFSMPRFNSSK